MPKKSSTNEGPEKDIKKKKRASKKKIVIGPVKHGDAVRFETLTVGKNENVTVDTGGKGTLHIGRFLMAGGTLQFTKPVTLKLVEQGAGGAAGK